MPEIHHLAPLVLRFRSTSSEVPVRPPRHTRDYDARRQYRVPGVEEEVFQTGDREQEVESEDMKPEERSGQVQGQEVGEEVVDGVVVGCCYAEGERG